MAGTLVLARRRGESILIGEDIEVMVISGAANVSHGVRLAVRAPANVAVDRAEIRAEKRGRIRTRACEGCGDEIPGNATWCHDCDCGGAR